MTADTAAQIDLLHRILEETGLLMQQISQGSVKSGTAAERVCALVAADVQKRVLQLKAEHPGPGALRRLRLRRAELGSLEFALRRASHEMNTALSQLLPAKSAGTYTADQPRLASAGAWMNVRSAP